MNVHTFRILTLSLILGFGLGPFGATVVKAAEPERTQVVLLEPLTMLLINGIGDMSVVSLGYERKLTGGPYSVQLHFHGGYSASGDADSYSGDTSWALGAGLTLRRYFGNTFDGSFGQVQSDYVRGETTTRPYYDPYYYDPSYNPQPTLSVTKQLYWMTQASIGYKWQWPVFVAEITIGGALYLTPAEKYTTLSAGFNVGAPF